MMVLKMCLFGSKSGKIGMNERNESDNTRMF